MISDIEFVKYVLVTNYSNYQKPESLLAPIRKIFGSRCVICLSPQDHAVRRRILNPAFNVTSIRYKVDRITINTRR
mgnify:CR=1